MVVSSFPPSCNHALIRFPALFLTLSLSCFFRFSHVLFFSFTHLPVCFFLHSFPRSAVLPPSPALAFFHLSYFADSLTYSLKTCSFTHLLTHSDSFLLYAHSLRFHTHYSSFLSIISETPMVSMSTFVSKTLKKSTILNFRKKNFSVLDSLNLNISAAMWITT